MRTKVFLGISILMIVFGCSSNDTEEIEKEPTVDYPCRYDYILKSVDNPIVSSGNGLRTIEFQINYSDYNVNDLGEPNVEKTCNYFKEIAYSEFNKYQSHFTNLGNLNPPTSYNIYVGRMRNNDYFYFDKNETKETQKIKVTFYCVH